MNKKPLLLILLAAMFLNVAAPALVFASPIGKQTGTAVDYFEGIVGIGTQAPSAKLDVAGQAVFGGAKPAVNNFMTLLVGSRPENDGLATIRLAPTFSSSGWSVDVGDNVSGKFFQIFDANNSQTRLYINNAGNVGIGTGAPDDKVDIRGPVNGTALSVSDPKAALRFAFGDGASYIQSGASPTAGGTRKDLLFTGIYGADPWMIMKADTGNVGIGTTTPSQKLEVIGTAKATDFCTAGGKCLSNLATSVESSMPPNSGTTTIDYVDAGPYTWTVPAGVTSITVEVWGGGGGGGGGGWDNALSGGSGGSGGYSSSIITVTPGTIYNIIVGVGGAAGSVAGCYHCAGAAGGDGSASSFKLGATTLVLANAGGGGDGGIVGQGPGQFGGLGASVGTGGTALAGIRGYKEGAYTEAIGAIAPNSEARLSNPGQGGTGGRSNGNTGNTSGGTGRSGAVTITYSGATTYETSCATGTSGLNYSYCCRIDTSSGRTTCKMSSGSDYSTFGAGAWQSLGTPFESDPAATNVSNVYSLSCTPGTSGINYPVCIRTNKRTGTTDCKYSPGTGSLTWTTCTSPF